MKIQNQLAELVKEYTTLPAAKRGPILAKIRLIGQTAAFFDGYDGMKRLHDAAEAVASPDTSIAYHLNHMWNGIGDWWA